MRNWSLLLLACTVSACATNGPTARALRAQQNTAVVLGFLDTAFNKHEVEKAFKLYVGPYYRQHNPHVPDGVDGAITALTHLTREVYPELRQDVKRTLAQGDLVAVHSRYTHGAAERAGSGGDAVVDIFRLEHGKIVEHWDVIESVPETPANDNSMF
ncbi:MAG TPA: ester cyclase [Steroidobacteraceae bacterium]|nr:ester cyclase [Steroidobacteraceae bacterium]